MSITDQDGNNRDAVIDLVAAGDTIRVSDDFATGAVGTPVDNTTYWSFPFTVSLSFEADDEPDDGEEESRSPLRPPERGLPRQSWRWS